jgi:Hint domain-containing protein
VTETNDAKMTTRRKLLTRDLKAICAMAVLPVTAQMIFPSAASARDRGDDMGLHFGDGVPTGNSSDLFGGGEGSHAGGQASQGAGACFLKGTRILTATGERKIEDLVPGDLISTKFGGNRPVQSIGTFRRIRDGAEKPWAKHARPVRIARSALAPEVPHRDLYVTGGHALLFDDVLIPAGSLINGTTISLYAADEYHELEFYHLKLETHDVIYAEGAPCETLLGSDAAVADFPHATDMATAGERHCVPIICNGPRNELKVRLRSLASPWLGPQRFDDVRTNLELRAVSLGAV